MVATIEELQAENKGADTALAQANEQLATATTGFENARSGPMEDLLKAAKGVESAQRDVAKADKQLKATAYAVEHFATVGIYESIKASVLKVADKWALSELLAHDVHEVVIGFSINDNGSVATDGMRINTLGKKTRIPGTNGGRRSKNMYVKDGESLNSREIVDRFGADVLGEEQASKVLAEPGRFGLTHAADRVAKDRGYEKQSVNGESK